MCWRRLIHDIEIEIEIDHGFWGMRAASMQSLSFIFVFVISEHFFFFACAIIYFALTLACGALWCCRNYPILVSNGSSPKTLGGKYHNHDNTSPWCQVWRAMCFSFLWKNRLCTVLPVFVLAVCRRNTRLGISGLVARWYWCWHAQLDLIMIHLSTYSTVDHLPQFITCGSGRLCRIYLHSMSSTVLNQEPCAITGDHIK